MPTDDEAITSAETPMLREDTWTDVRESWVGNAPVEVAPSTSAPPARAVRPQSIPPPLPDAGIISRPFAPPPSLRTMNDRLDAGNRHGHAH